MEALFCGGTEPVVPGLPVTLVVLRNNVEPEGLIGVVEVVASFVEFQKLTMLGAAPAMLVFARPLEFGFAVKDEPLLGTFFSLGEPVDFVVVECPVEPILLLFESAVSFDTVAEVGSPKTPRMASAMKRSIEVPFATCMLLAIVLFEACLLFALTPDVESSTEMGCSLEILEFEDISLKG